MKLLSSLIQLLIRMYQMSIRPMLGPRCRFVPGCSEYALQSISRFGVGKGTILALRRVAKCHPLHPGGFDPVPQVCEEISAKISNSVRVPTN